MISFSKHKILLQQLKALATTALGNGWTINLKSLSPLPEDVLPACSIAITEDQQDEELYRRKVGVSLYLQKSNVATIGNPTEILSTDLENLATKIETYWDEDPIFTLTALNLTYAGDLKIASALINLEILY